MTVRPALLRLSPFYLLALLALTAGGQLSAAEPSPKMQKLLKQIGVERGICVFVGQGADAAALEAAKNSELVIHAQLSGAEQVATARAQADKAGLLGTRIYFEQGSALKLQLANDMADAVVLVGGGDADALQEEAFRVLRPQGKLIFGERARVKPPAAGSDDWSHPYHGPDNNPQSTDANAKGPYLTHFLSSPWYGPMPEVTVSSGGRMFKAFGHISFKKREWPLLNTLIALNSYNGTELWRRKLQEGFMIHRNTMIATPDTLLLADDKSCKMIDAATGKIKDELIPPDAITTDKVWKWMALDDGVLYALLGPKEKSAAVLNGVRTKPGWPWNELGQGYAQQNYPWGFGTTLIAFDLASKNPIWVHKEKEPIDSRALCMNSGRLFIYSHGKYLRAIGRVGGKVLWSTEDAKLMAQIGQHDRAQNPRLGYTSTTYAKCNQDAIFFAGPQRHNLVTISAKDGKMLWSYPHGNYQLIVRPDALYAMGRTDSSKKFDLLTGKMLADLECFRGNCTRATATVDSIFTRGHPHTGTQRILLDSDKSTRIGLMRPGCHDGVLVTGGHLFWGPWMCDCNLQLVGVISLGPSHGIDVEQPAVEAERLSLAAHSQNVAAFAATEKDWPTYRADNRRSSGAAVELPKAVKMLWRRAASSSRTTTAPIAAGGLAFIASGDGSVRGIDCATGKTRWTAYTGGRIFYPPSLKEGRLFVGSADGFIYALEAATGRTLWRFRAAPHERKIPVYGHLSSTWPVASGALAEGETVYAAAGIASYDGTHLYALDAATGKIRWQNNTSGRMVGEGTGSGVSVQGHLLLNKDRLYMAGGNVVSPAVYNAANGECLNKFDEWDKAPRGSELFLVGDEVHAFDRLLYSPQEDQLGRYFNQRFVQASLGDCVIRGREKQLVRLAAQSKNKKTQVGLWENRDMRGTAALAVAKNMILAAGQLSSKKLDEAGQFALAAIDRENGQTLWTEKLPAPPALWGLAIDRDGRILLTLENGDLICFGEK